MAMITATIQFAKLLCNIFREALLRHFCLAVSRQMFTVLKLWQKAF